jgi:hypothetical protein
MIPTNAADALVINLWGLQASATGQVAIYALCAIVFALIVSKRLQWW